MLKEKTHELDYKRLERDNILKDIDDLTDANQGLKRALDEAQQEVCRSLRIPLNNESTCKQHTRRIPIYLASTSSYFTTDL